MFDISKPRKHSETAELVKLSHKCAEGGQGWAKSSLALHPGLALTVNLHPDVCLGDGGRGGH